MILNIVVLQCVQALDTDLQIRIVDDCLKVSLLCTMVTGRELTLIHYYRARVSESENSQQIFIVDEIIRNQCGSTFPDSCCNIFEYTSPGMSFFVPCFNGTIGQRADRRIFPYRS